MSNAISLKEAQQRLFKKHGNTISILDYYAMNSYAKFQCNICGYIWSAVASSTIGSKIKTGCPNCALDFVRKKFRFPFDKIKKYIEDNACEILSSEDEYKNRRGKLKIKFSCGHIKMMSFEVFKRGVRCNCDSFDRAKKTSEKKMRQKVFDRLKSLGFIFVSFENDFASFRNNITYICNNGHSNTRNIRNFLSKSTCIICSKIYLSEFQKGELGNNWQGGITKLITYTKKAVWQWRKASIKSCNEICIISGRKYETVHHLYSFTRILREALKEFGLEEYEFIGDYNRKDLQFITDRVEKLHWKYPLGVCLTKPIHKLFHKLYGERDFTPEDFREFQSRIQSGEIQIPD